MPIREYKNLQNFSYINYNFYSKTIFLIIFFLHLNTLKPNSHEREWRMTAEWC